MNLLEVKDLSISFGGLKAVQDVSFSVPQGKIVSVIGPNGAGKTTIFNMLTGFYLPDQGSIKLAGTEMVGKKSYEFIACGIARTFQNIRLYAQMTVLENVLIGYQCRLEQSLWDSLFNTKQKKRTEAEALEKAREDVAIQQKEQIGDAKITAQEETVEVRDGVLYYRVDVDCEENIGVESEVFLQS